MKAKHMNELVALAYFCSIVSDEKKIHDLDTRLITATSMEDTATIATPMPTLNMTLGMA
jgi:hypothetical protein